MNDFYFTALKNNVVRRTLPSITTILIIAAAVMVAGQSVADEYPFQAVYEDVPGAGEVEAGKVRAGIRILEKQLKQVEQENTGDVWATLCAAYIVNESMGKAEHACAKAVAIAPTYSAFNNRGVLRVINGDLSGAREDFERVRPLELDAYLEELTTKDVRVIADNNFRLTNELLARHRVPQISASVEVSAAEIEDLNN